LTIWHLRFCCFAGIWGCSFVGRPAIIVCNAVCNRRFQTVWNPQREGGGRRLLTPLVLPSPSCRRQFAVTSIANGNVIK
jgi:hypothetical protein